MILSTNNKQAYLKWECGFYYRFRMFNACLYRLNDKKRRYGVSFMTRKGEKDKFEKVKDGDKPTRWNEEERTELDKFKDQQFVDDIPLEDLKIEQEDEKDKHKTKDDSQSERKYK